MSTTQTRGVRIALTGQDAEYVGWCLEYASRFLDSDSMPSLIFGGEHGPGVRRALIVARGLLEAAVADWPDDVPTVSEETDARPTARV